MINFFIVQVDLLDIESEYENMIHSIERSCVTLFQCRKSCFRLLLKARRRMAHLTREKKCVYHAFSKGQKRNVRAQKINTEKRHRKGNQEEKLCGDSNLIWIRQFATEDERLRCIRIRDMGKICSKARLVLLVLVFGVFPLLRGELSKLFPYFLRRKNCDRSWKRGIYQASYGITFCVIIHARV